MGVKDFTAGFKYPEFGVCKKKKPPEIHIWDGEKLYDKTLHGKYTNILQYLDSFAFTSGRNNAR